jgi:hypothetical protein
MPCTATRSPARAPGIAQRVENRDAGAEQRRGIGGGEIVGIAATASAGEIMYS